MGQKIDPFGLVMGLGSMGLNIFGGLSERDRAYRDQKRAIRQQNQQAAMARNFQNLQIRKQNQYAQQAFQVKKGIVAQQKALNLEAAERAYAGVQINRDRQLTAMAFNREDRTSQLLEAVGANAASIDPGNRSAQRAAAMRTYGRFGRQQVQDQMQVRDLNESSRLQTSDIFGQLRAANAQADAQVAIAPYMQSELPPAFQMAGPSGPTGLSTALMIGQGFMGGIQTYNQFAPGDAQLGRKFP